MQRLPLLALALIAVSCTRPAVDRPKIGLAPRVAGPSSTADFRGSLEAAAAGNADLAVAEGEDTQAEQNAQAVSLLDAGCRAVALAPIDVGYLDPVIKEAKAKRSPVVFFGLEPHRKVMRSWDKLFFVGTRREDFGAAQGEILAELWRSDPSADRDRDGTLSFVVLAAAGDGDGAARQAEATTKALAAASVPSATLDKEEAGEGVEAARKRASAALAVYGQKIEAFVCQNEDLALGAAEALKAAGYKGKKRVPVVGAELGSASGEMPEAVAAALASGEIVGTVAQDSAAQGRAVFDLAYALARGAAPRSSGLKIADAKYVWVPCRKVTKASLAPEP